MKRGVLLFFLFVLFCCKSELDLTLTGTWEVSFSTPSHNYSGPMNLNQNKNNTLTGTFDWGGGHYTLDATSQINGNEVIIDWQDNMHFKGTVNSDFDFMMGDISVFHAINNTYTPYGTWSAIKSSK